MKKSIILLFLNISLTTLLISSCQKTTNNQNDYNAIKAKISKQANGQPSGLTLEEQNFFYEELATKMRNDQDFKAYNHSLRETMLVYLDRDRSKYKEIGRAPKNFKERVDFYRSRGIKNPEKLIFDQLRIMITLGKVNKKFPELNKLDSKTRSMVMKKAGAGLDLKTKKKMNVIMQKKAEENSNKK